MSESKKFKIFGVLAVFAAICSALYWDYAIILTIALFLISFAMMAVEGNRGAVIVFVIAFIFGPLTESLLIKAGAWTYAEPHIFGFPIWLPFLWGTAGLFFNRLNKYAEHKLGK